MQTAVPVLTRLAAATTLSAHLAVLDGHEIVYLVRRVPNHAFASNIRIGSRLPAHATNMGRSILANLPRDRVDRLYSDFDLRPVTPRTPVTPLQLRAQLDADRTLGLAWSDGNYEAGIQLRGARRSSMCPIRRSLPLTSLVRPRRFGKAPSGGHRSAARSEKPRGRYPDATWLA